MNNRFDTLVVITKPDLMRVRSNFLRLIKWLSEGRIILNENDVIPFDTVHKVMTDKMQPLLNGRELPRGITGWYYQ